MKVGAMNLKTILLVPAVGLALVAAGCGSGDDKSTDKASSPQDAAKQAVLDWTFKGDCDLMTDKFLEAQAFIGDDRKERCDYFEKAFHKPQYQESDVKFRKVTVTGDKAVVTVG